jgi:hypothetical protein
MSRCVSSGCWVPAICSARLIVAHLLQPGMKAVPACQGGQPGMHILYSKGTGV